jgi:hypothetical protein
LPSKNIIGTAGFINAEENAGHNPFEQNKGTAFLTQWEIKHTLLGLQGNQTASFVYSFDRNKIDYDAYSLGASNEPVLNRLGIQDERSFFLETLTHCKVCLEFVTQSSMSA